MYYVVGILALVATGAIIVAVFSFFSIPIAIILTLILLSRRSTSPN